MLSEYAVALRRLPTCYRETTYRLQTGFYPVCTRKVGNVVTLANTYRPLSSDLQDSNRRTKINWSWLIKRSPMVALALLSSWGVGGFILQSGKANYLVAFVGAGAFDLVFLGVIALADQALSIKPSTHRLYWVLNIGAAIMSALLNTLYYSGGNYASITPESVTHGAPFAIFGLLYSLYYHSVMSEAIAMDVEAKKKEDDKAAEDALKVECRYCGQSCKNKQAEYSHYRTCVEHPNNKKG